MNTWNFSKHSLKRMKKRDITVKDVITTLRYGVKKAARKNSSFIIDMADLRVITAESTIITAFFLDPEHFRNKKDCRRAKLLRNQKLAALREADLAEELAVIAC